MAYVYKHIRDDKNEVFYIGIGTCENRINSHANRNKHWHNIVNKYGYTVEVFADNLCWEQACQLEIMLIARYGRIDNNTGVLVNMTDGGEGIQGYHHNDSTRLKMSRVQRKLDEIGVDELTQIIKNNGNVKSSNILSVSVPSLITYKKNNNIEVISDIQRININKGWKLVAQMNTGKRKCDNIDNLTELLKTHGIIKTSKLLNISYATIRSYCDEKGIMYKKHHDGPNRRREFNEDELTELLDKYSLSKVKKILKTSREAIYRFCDERGIEVKQRLKK